MSGILDKIRIRKFQKLNWHRPGPVLKNLRYIETHALDPKMNKRERNLRTNTLKEWREARDAAIFAYGIENQLLKAPIFVAKSEESDYDFVLRWVINETESFAPVQLKELPPDELNSEITLDDLYHKLEKYSGTDDLVVVIKINRRGRFNWMPWQRKNKLPIKELWFFGCTTEDQSKWFFVGDILDEPRFFEFEYPVGEPEFA